MADLRRRKLDNEDEEQIISDDGCSKTEKPERGIDNKHKNLHITLKATDSTDNVNNNMTKFLFFVFFLKYK